MHLKCEICGATGLNAHTRSYCSFASIIRNNVEDINLTYLFHNMKSLSCRL